VAYVGLSGGLQVIRLDGGIARELGPAGCCAHWADDGYIYFSSLSGIARVREDGGEFEILSGEPGENLRDPVLSPDGTWVLFSVLSNDLDAIRIDAVHLESGERRQVVEGARPGFSPQGHLVWGTNDGLIVWMPVDPETLDSTGPRVPLADDLSVLADGQRALSLARDGTLAYIGGPQATGLAELVWVSRTGSVTPAAPGFEFPLSANQTLRLAPDGTRIAVNYFHDGNDDVFIKTLPDGPVDRLTVSPAQDFRPFWDGSGTEVYYFSGPSVADRRLWAARADGSGTPRLVMDSEESFAEGEWHPDGLVLRSSATVAMGVELRGIYLAETAQPGAVPGEPRPWLATAEFVEEQPAVSPNGDLLAYVSDRGGELAVYVTRFDDPNGARALVSTGGGRAPRWASDTELLFVDADRTMMAADIDAESLEVTNRRALFPIPTEVAGGGWAQQVLYDVRRGDPRILMVRPKGAAGQLRNRVVFNAFSGLGGR
jgi:Tol biopolymer transport system component